jgi:hypothetical protein
MRTSYGKVETESVHKEDGLMFNVNQQKQEESDMNKKKFKEQVKVYAITYISYALIHF